MAAACAPLAPGLYPRRLFRSRLFRAPAHGATAVTRRIFLQLVLAALLLFGQQVALTHALTHGPAPQQQKETGKGSFQSGSCNLHGVYGQILGAMPSSPASHAEQSLS